MVDDTKTAEKGNVDGHVVLGDCVHGRGDKGRLEGDALCDGRVEVYVDGGKAWVHC